MTGTERSLSIGRLARWFASPGVALMNRLRLPAKFVLISACLALPMGVVLTGFVRDLQRSLEFSRRELEGTELLRPLRKLLELELNDSDAVQIRHALERVKVAQRSVSRPLMGTARQDLDGLPESSKATPERVRDVRGAILEVGDASNLILDPDLDTYYLMDSVVVRLPAMLTAAADLASETEPRGSDETGKVEGTRTSAIRAKLLAEWSSVRRGIRVAMASTTDTTLQRHIEPPVLAVARTLGQDAPASAALLGFWDIAVDELDRLLRRRIDRIEARRDSVLWLTGIGLVLACYAWVAFYMALMRTVDVLVAAPARLTADKLEPVIVETRDELGRTVASFNEVALRLRKEWRVAREEEKRARAAEASLRDSEERVRRILDAALIAIVVTDEQGRVTEWNPQASLVFGFTREEVVGSEVWPRLVGTIEQARFASLRVAARAAPDGRPAEHTHLIAGRRSDGTSFTAEVSLVAIRRAEETSCVAFFVDLSEKIRLEADLRSAQKLESVGRLASGIAHEINTPIQYVSDSIHFVSDAHKDLANLVTEYRELRRSLVKSESSPQDLRGRAIELGRAEEASDLDYLLENVPPALNRSLDGLGRVADLVSAMKEFAHPDQKVAAPVDLNRAIQSTLVIASNEYKGVAELETSFGELPPIMCVAGEVNQVVLNLVVNAAHAIEDAPRAEGAKGKIRVVTRLDGAFVSIEITDSGTGIPEPAREHIFDPFFTTKEVGKGTGQGLTLARSLVTRHCGSIRFETEIGRGTTFFVRLPVYGPQR